jgi:2-hydroxy-3-keto-5-methylthiopentenyl-1-phosphate phosphatase
MGAPKTVETLVQCDFDGTITETDVSFLLLDSFAAPGWRRILDDYKAGKISVNSFNVQAFSTIAADKQTLLKFVSDRMRVRAGFKELLSFCHGRNFKFVIVSNGLDFYIDEILRIMGTDGVKVRAAQTSFVKQGMKVKFVGPDGQDIQDGFKETHVRLFLEKGYRVVYVGNGVSDVSPAKLSHHVFATGDLLDYCRQADLKYMPFTDLNDVVKGLERLP